MYGEDGIQEVVRATESERECLGGVVVSDDGDRQVVPVLGEDAQQVGVFQVVLEKEMSAITLENLLVLARGLGPILQKIYSIRQRLTYYSNDCRSLNQLAQQFYTCYLSLTHPSSTTLD